MSTKVADMNFDKVDVDLLSAAASADLRYAYVALSHVGSGWIVLAVGTHWLCHDNGTRIMWSSSRNEWVLA